MTRDHRRIHRLIWPALTLGVCFAFIMALVLRPPAENVPPPTKQESNR